MINGLPFTRPFMLPFGGPFFKNNLFPEPSGFVAKYQAYNVDDFTLVTGSNVSQWDDISTNANHLTQGTSTNQPTLTQDANSFNNTVDFGTNDYMEGLPVQSGDFTYVFKGLSNLSDTGAHHLLLSGVSNIISQDALWINLNGTRVTFNDGAVKQLTISNPLWNSNFNLVLTYSSGIYNLYINGTFESSVAGSPIQPINLGGSNTSLDGSLQEL